MQVPLVSEREKHNLESYANSVQKVFMKTRCLINNSNLQFILCYLGVITVLDKNIDWHKLVTNSSIIDMLTRTLP